MKPMFPALLPHWKARRRFAGTDAWAVYLYNRVLRRIPRLPLPGRRSITSVKLKGDPDPFHVRLGATDLLVLDEMFQAREYEFAQQTLSNVRNIVDLGANVGFSLRYWHRVFPDANIVAVEPDPENFFLCASNVRAAGFSNQVTMVQACVGSHRRGVRLDGRVEWAYQMKECQPAGEGMTDVLPMTELLDNHAKGQPIDLLKCDIEGAEREIFQDCRSWISRVKAIIIELHPPYTPCCFLADLLRAGAQFRLTRQFTEKQFPILMLECLNAGVPTSESDISLK